MAALDRAKTAESHGMDDHEPEGLSLLRNLEHLCDTGESLSPELVELLGRVAGKCGYIGSEALNDFLAEVSALPIPRSAFVAQELDRQLVAIVVDNPANFAAISEAYCDVAARHEHMTFELLLHTDKDFAPSSAERALGRQFERVALPIAG